MSEPKILKPVLLLISAAFLFVFIALPLYTIVSEALKDGLSGYFSAISDDYAIINTVFGVMIAYAAAKFEFRGKTVLLTLLDMPFAVSPVIAGLMFVLLFGNSGFLGKFFSALNFDVIFALPGILLASAFVTFPFVAKETLLLMQEQGNSEEEAAFSLGAGGLRTFFSVTLPNIKWGLFYGVVLTNARAMGEFGAVAVVSGKIIGLTTTMPLYIEILYSDYLYVAAFSVASLLLLLSVVTLALKFLVQKASKRG